MVNILLSTYNGEDYITEQLDSIFLQEYQDFKVYIRDDGSKDNTVNVVENYIAEHGLENRIVLKKGKNIGFSPSFFELIHMAGEGDYWAFCDQDDVWYPDKIKRAVDWMESQKEKEIPLLHHGAFEQGNEDLTIKTPHPIANFPYNFINSITCSLIPGFTITINRGMYEYLVRANPKNVIYHDWFAFIIANALGKIHVSKHVVAVHRMHENNASPWTFWKSIPVGLKLMKGDAFYKKNAKECKTLFEEKLKPREREILNWFANDKYSFKIACKKAFYPHRWNCSFPVEIILRMLMLIGKV